MSRARGGHHQAFERICTHRARSTTPQNHHRQIVNPSNHDRVQRRDDDIAKDLRRCSRCRREALSAKSLNCSLAKMQERRTTNGTLSFSEHHGNAVCRRGKGSPFCQRAGAQSGWPKRIVEREHVANRRKSSPGSSQGPALAESPRTNRAGPSGTQQSLCPMISWVRAYPSSPFLEKAARQSELILFASLAQRRSDRGCCRSGP